jgi:hypothetical protein
MQRAEVWTWDHRIPINGDAIVPDCHVGESKEPEDFTVRLFFVLAPSCGFGSSLVAGAGSAGGVATPRRPRL